MTTTKKFPGLEALLVKTGPLVDKPEHPDEWLMLDAWNKIYDPAKPAASNHPRTRTRKDTGVGRQKGAQTPRTLSRGADKGARQPRV